MILPAGNKRPRTLFPRRHGIIDKENAISFPAVILKDRLLAMCREGKGVHRNAEDKGELAGELQAHSPPLGFSRGVGQRKAQPLILK
jgi:hypothetical protein